jgi:hypothetical protein
MADRHLCVAIYTTHDQADEALSRLRAEGFGMESVSFVGREYWKEMIGSRNAGERFVHRGANGPFWERLWSILPGWGVFWFFENGPALVAGPLVRTIVATQEEGGGDSRQSRFASGLSNIGIPKESIAEYEKALMKNHVLVFILGALGEIDRAQDILNKTKSINHTIHHNCACEGKTLG